MIQAQTVARSRASLHPRFLESERKYGTLPARYASLGRYSAGLMPQNILEFRVFEYGDGPPTYMLTTSDRHADFLRRDLQSLLDLGLELIRSNNPGEMSVYFNDRYNKFTSPRHSR